MSRFSLPNLPLNQVTDVIVSGEYSYIIDELNKLGISTIITAPSIDLPYYERYHPDMQCSYYKKGTLAVSNNNPYFANSIAMCGIHINRTDTKLIPNYPHNISFNHVIIGNKIICNEKYTDKKILEYCKKNNLKIINVKQGYTKCSTVVVNENAVITSDPSIYNSCIKNDIDVLKIDSGYISLYGYDYGFIGGCCGKLSNDILAFTGKINGHKNYKNIKSFLHNHGVYISELSNKPLLDIGSIIPFKEATEK